MLTPQQSQISHTRVRVKGLTCANCTNGVIRRYMAAPRVEVAVAESPLLNGEQTFLLTSNQPLDAGDIFGTLGGSKFEAIHQESIENILTLLKPGHSSSSSCCESNYTKAAVLLGLGLPYEAISIFSHLIPSVKSVYGKLIYGGYGLCSMLLSRYAGKEYFAGGWEELKKFYQCPPVLGMNSLISLSSITSWAYSYWVIAETDRFEEFSLETYFSVPLILIGFLKLTQAIKERINATIYNQLAATQKKFLALQPTNCRIINENAVREGEESKSNEAIIDINQTQKGHKVIVRFNQGDGKVIIPVDGQIDRGEALVNEEIITGNSHDSQKGVGQMAYAGTELRSGYLEIIADGPVSNHLIVKTMFQIKMASAEKPKFFDTLETCARWITPLVIMLAAGAAVAWYYFSSSDHLQYAFCVALSVLVSACPCAIGAVPLAASTLRTHVMQYNGMLICKDSAVEKILKTTHIVFDKTGTLTENPSLLIEQIQIIAASREVDRNQQIKYYLNLAADAEQQLPGQQHPVAQAIIQCRNASAMAAPPVTMQVSQDPTTLGITINYNDQTRYLGSSQFVLNMMQGLAMDNSFTQNIQTRVDEIANQGGTAVVLLDNIDAEPVVTIFPVRHQPKPEARETISRCLANNWVVSMVSGDTQRACEYFRDELGFNASQVEVHGGQSSQDKLEYIQAKKQQGHIVAMAGDGLNDSGAMLVANVGIAMSPANFAATCAHVVLSGSLAQIHRFHEYAKATKRNMQVGLALAFAYNVIAAFFSIWGSYAIFGTTLHPVAAALAMIVSSLNVTLNASLFLQRTLNQIDQAELPEFESTHNSDRELGQEDSIGDVNLAPRRWWRFIGSDRGRYVAVNGGEDPGRSFGSDV